MRTKKQCTKLISLLLSCLIVLQMIPIQVFATESAQSGICGGAVTWRLDGDVLYIEGEGEMYDFLAPRSVDDDPDDHITYVPWSGIYVSKIVIGEGITYIGEFAFYEMYDVVEVKLPSTLKGIGMYVFGYMESLEEAILPEGLTTMGECAFSACDSLTTVSIPSTLKVIPYNAFWQCTSLTDLTNKGDGKYTFKMPASKVTVKATFMDDNTMLNFFVDVPADAYYYDAVLWAVKEGITNGTSATTFSPGNPCTRAQMATFLWRAAGSPEPASKTCPFVDVAADAYYAKAVQWAYEQGITGGTSATTYSPDETCTRGQMATFLSRVADGKPVSEKVIFADVNVDKYYAKAVQWAYEQKITSGTSITTFSPDDPCTRAQMVTFLYRYFVK